jgi:hypothetical protein
LSTSPRAALEAAKKLVGQWPHAKPADPETYAAALAAVLTQYPLGLVEECVDPRRGLSRSREFPPTISCLVEWCDTRLDWHQKLAAYRPIAERPPEPHYSDEHRATMLQRLSKLMHDVFDTNVTSKEPAA